MELFDNEEIKDKVRHLNDRFLGTSGTEIADATNELQVKGFIKGVVFTDSTFKMKTNIAFFSSAEITELGIRYLQTHTNLSVEYYNSFY